MRIVVLGGCGDMGSHVVRDLLEYSDSHVVIADRRAEAAQRMVRDLGERTSAEIVDASEEAALVESMRGCDAAVGCIGPFFQFAARQVRSAIRAGTPLVDICDDWGPIDEIMGMTSWAEALGVPVVTGLGWTPGITNLVAKREASGLDEVESIRVSWVGSAADSTGFAPVMHMAYSISGNVPAYVNGELVQVKARTGIEVVKFPPPLGPAAVSNCGHPEPLTLPERLKAENVSVKGGLTPEWANRMTDLLAHLGLFDNDLRMRRTSQAVHAVEGVLRTGGVPYSAARVDVSGKRGGHRVTSSWAVVDKMGRLAGIPASIGALMLANHQINSPGVHAPEDVVDPELFFHELARRGIVLVNMD